MIFKRAGEDRPYPHLYLETGVHRSSRAARQQRAMQRAHVQHDGGAS